MKTVLITGANGTIGARLVKEYLGRPQYLVFALVRGDSQDAALRRMQQPMSFWGVSPAVQEARLRVVRGDVTTSSLGLSAEVLKELLPRLSLLIHAASSIRLNLPLPQARETIVEGTKNALELALRSAALERFGYVSTMEVAGDHRGVVPEDYLSDIPRGFLNSYEIAKSEAEEYLKRSSASGTPITVLRPSMVVGEAATGRAMSFQSFYLMLEKLLLEPDFPILPRGCPIDTVPIDVLAQGIVALMEHPEARGQVYNFAQGLDDRISFEDLVGRLRPKIGQYLGLQIRSPVYVPPAIYHAPLRVLQRLTWGPLRRAISSQLVFIKYLSMDWQFQSARTKATLRSLGVEFPPFEDYLPALLEYYRPRRGENTLPF